MLQKGGEYISNAISETTNATFSAITSNTSTTAKSNDAYIYWVDFVAFLAIDICVFLEYNKKSSQAINKEQANKRQQQPIKPPKRRDRR